MKEDILDSNIFMMCEKLNKNALTEFGKDYYFRNCRPDELGIWKALPFDSEKVPDDYEDFMNQYIRETYSKNLNMFLLNTLFVCDRDDKPIATCSYWKAYGKINTIQWLKTHKDYEGKGIGRALLSEIMKRFDNTDYPIYLHTQLGSFRAIKSYSDFGFHLLKGGQLGTRTNDLEKCLPILEKFIPESVFEKLRVIETPLSIIKDLENETTIQF